ncbi:MAG TPA: hypothetical protein VF546_00330 [Pyrinomonadaceae bacterium]|jgi:hypothetical protein
MMNPQPKPANVTARTRGLMVLWGAQFVTIAILVALTRFIPIAPSAGEDALRFQLLDVLGGATFALSFVVKYLLLRRAVATQRPDAATTAYVLAFALCELTALLGLVNYFLTGRPIVLLFALAAFGLLFHFPRRAHLEAAAADTSKGLDSTMR